MKTLFAQKVEVDTPSTLTSLSVSSSSDHKRSFSEFSCSSDGKKLKKKSAPIIMTALETAVETDRLKALKLRISGILVRTPGTGKKFRYLYLKVF